MKKQDNIWFTPSGCISADGLKAFVYQQLNENERRELEVHLNDCELCSAAVKGMQTSSITQPDFLVKVQELSARTNEHVAALKHRQASQRKASVSLFVSVAASLLLFIGVYTYLEMTTVFDDNILTQNVITENYLDTLILVREARYPDDLRPKPPMFDVEPSSRGQLTDKHINDTYYANASSSTGDFNDEVFLETIVPAEKDIDETEIQVPASVDNGNDNGVMALSEPTIVMKKSVFKTDDVTKISRSKRTTLGSTQVNISLSDSEAGNIYMLVDTMPRFKGGGVDSFQQYLQENMKFMVDNSITLIYKDITVGFVIDENGYLTCPEVKVKNNQALASEIIHMLKKSPRWQPGYLNGIPVKVKLTVELEIVGR